jgi:hypothetical protein
MSCVHTHLKPTTYYVYCCSSTAHTLASGSSGCVSSACGRVCATMRGVALPAHRCTYEPLPPKAAASPLALIVAQHSMSPPVSSCGCDNVQGLGQRAGFRFQLRSSAHALSWCSAQAEWTPPPAAARTMKDCFCTAAPSPIEHAGAGLAGACVE